ncbi:MAG: bga2 [Frondihabitans sp.]|nr:bga2 [Frondihabitans sp.]
MGLKYGGDYNPEQWPEEVWSEDVRLMREAGVNFVTVGVFSWALLEPSEGLFEFGWLDRILDLLHANGIAVDLATATASPPPWLSTEYPETLPVDRNGRTLWPGGRQHYCPSSPVYRSLAARLAGRIAERYAEHPAVVLWHINNEYGCHTSECFCDVSAASFREWLRAKYGTVEQLNAAWTTAFWSQLYGSFDQIQPPRATPVFANPSQVLDYHRFSSGELLECFRAEKVAIREFSPDLPVTTNFIGVFRHVDYWKWVDEIDVISDDSYPDPLDPDAAVGAAMARDLMRSLGRGRPWILMEQATGYVNWRAINGTKPGTMMKALSMQAVARGADGINFFQWRQSQGGAEKFHSGMLPHSGTRSRIWHQVVDLGHDLQALHKVEGTRSSARVAFVLDWESWWAAEGEAHQVRLDFHDNLVDWYRPFHSANVAVDFVHPDDDLSAYQLVVAPHLYLYSDATANNLARYVDEGGHLVVTWFSGHVDEHDRARLDGYFGALQDVLGVSIDDFAALGRASVAPVWSQRWGTFSGSQWSEYLHLRGAQTHAAFSGGDVDGLPAVISHAFGSGTAWYFATLPDPAALRRVLEDVWSEAGVEPVVRDLPGRVEASVRGELLFVINQDAAPVDLPLGGFDVLTEADVDRPTLDGFGTLVIELSTLRIPEGSPPVVAEALASEEQVEVAR